MAIMSGFFGCFSGSSKVVDHKGSEEYVVSRKARNVDNNLEAKGKGRKGAPIPVAYFPIGSNLSHL
ncbi:hypothetical protein Hanom_Chr17g01541591 [Helianthus anomalus]